MEWVAAVLLVALLLGGVAVAAVVAVVLAVRRVALAAGRRAGVGVRALGPGPGGEVARLRRDVDRAVAAARRSLALARAAGAPLGDCPSLLARLEAAAGAVDAELRLVECIHDPRRRADGVRAAGARARAVVTGAVDLADGLRAAAARVVPDTAGLRADCAIEAEALRAATGRVGPGTSPPVR